MFVMHSFFCFVENIDKLSFEMEKILQNAGVVDGELITDTVLTRLISYGPLARSLNLNLK